MINRLVKSFSNALNGLFFAFLKGRNFRIQILAGVIVVFLMFYLSVVIIEKVILLLLIALVLSLELINTGSERILNILEPRIHPQVRIIKDLAAASVLLMSFFSIIIGIIILWPYL